MKIASFNVNGINGRLPVLMRWLAAAEPDVVCLQELKAASERFPESAIREVGYGAIWHGQKSWNGVAILARGTVPIETRRGLPGDPDDTHSRYIEAAVNGILNLEYCCGREPGSFGGRMAGGTTETSGDIEGRAGRCSLRDMEAALR